MVAYMCTVHKGVAKMSVNVLLCKGSLTMPMWLHICYSYKEASIAKI